MQSEFLRVIDQVSKEKGIDRALIIETIEEAMKSAAKKTHGADINVEAKFDTTTREGPAASIHSASTRSASVHRTPDAPRARARNSSRGIVPSVGGSPARNRSARSSHGTPGRRRVTTIVRRSTIRPLPRGSGPGGVSLYT